MPNGAQRYQLYFQRRHFAETIRKKQPDKIRCDQCGKPMNERDAIKRDNRILCADCYNRVHGVKDKGKE